MDWNFLLVVLTPQRKSMSTTFKNWVQLLNIEPKFEYYKVKTFLSNSRLFESLCANLKGAQFFCI